VRPIAVYVHIPFCTVKCGYCDFNAYAGMDNLKFEYGRALVSEIDALGDLLEGRVVSTIGFGGGTPGEIPAGTIGSVIAALRQRAPLAPRAEVSLELNPGTTSEDAIRDLRAFGVTRLSIGAQSFDPAELRFLDRIHSPEATVASVRLARRAGFESVGLDLIYGLPGQSRANWAASLAAATALGPDHVSTYALTVEDGTMLARRVARGEVEPLDGDAVADLYDLATEALEAAGYEQYELSNWARPGHQSRHNRTYWTDGEYLAIGAGAHGYHNGERYENIAHPRTYIAAVEAGSSPPFVALANRYAPDCATSMSDWLALRLRLIEGFTPVEFAGRFGVRLPPAVTGVLEECRSAGVIEYTAERVRLSRSGRLLHGEVASRLLLACRQSAADGGN
jgi:oxygen-independent coproporphyrinogen-3 oxidase